MLVPGIIKLSGMSTMLQIWHADIFVTSRCRYSGDFCFKEDWFEVGRLSICP